MNNQTEELKKLVELLRNARTTPQTPSPEAREVRRREKIGGVTMAHVIDKEELPHSETAYTFEGYLYGDTNVSFFLSETPPGRGPELHKHPYAEVFVVQEGDLTFTVGDDTIEVTGGQIVVAPAGVAHKFVNSGTGRARHINIHASRRMTTEWLED